MAYSVEFTEYSLEDFEGLDSSLKKLASKQILKLEQSPEYGESLGNRDGLDLTGFYKLYFNKKKHRIVYRLIEEDDDLIAEIIAIGARDKNYVYKQAHSRK